MFRRKKVQHTKCWSLCNTARSQQRVGCFLKCRLLFTLCAKQIHVLAAGSSISSVKHKVNQLCWKEEFLLKTSAAEVMQINKKKWDEGDFFSPLDHGLLHQNRFLCDRPKNMSSKEVSCSAERRVHSLNTMWVCAAPYPPAAVSSQRSRTNTSHT